MYAFPFSDHNKRYHTYAAALRRRYGGRVARVPLDGGFGCPNREGKRGGGGCIFCSGRGSGDQIPQQAADLAAQYTAGIAKLQKWQNARYIPYFQAFTGTYAPLDRLRALYDEALALPGAVGLAVATRADCIDRARANLLAAYAARTDVTVEIGVQSVHDRTLARIRRGETFADITRALALLRGRGIDVWVHLINGLPGETREEMVQSARVLGALGIDGIKIHLLHVLRDTALAEQDYTPLTMDEYVQTVCDQLEVLPPRVVIGRLTGDGDRAQLLAPLWSCRKREVLNAIDGELRRRNSWQGRKWLTDC